MGLGLTLNTNNEIRFSNATLLKVFLTCVLIFVAYFLMRKNFVS